MSRYGSPNSVGLREEEGVANLAPDVLAAQGSVPTALMAAGAGTAGIGVSAPFRARRKVRNAVGEATRARDALATGLASPGRRGKPNKELPALNDRAKTARSTLARVADQNKPARVAGRMGVAGVTAAGLVSAGMAMSRQQREQVGKAERRSRQNAWGGGGGVGRNYRADDRKGLATTAAGVAGAVAGGGLASAGYRQYRQATDAVPRSRDALRQVKGQQGKAQRALEIKQRMVSEEKARLKAGGTPIGMTLKTREQNAKEAKRVVGYANQARSLREKQLREAVRTRAVQAPRGRLKLAAGVGLAAAGAAATVGGNAMSERARRARLGGTA